jgi:hypothetical protein
MLCCRLNFLFLAATIDFLRGKTLMDLFSRDITIKKSGETPLLPRPPPRQAIVAASHHCSDGDNQGPLPHASAL